VLQTNSCRSLGAGHWTVAIGLLNFGQSSHTWEILSRAVVSVGHSLARSCSLLFSLTGAVVKFVDLHLAPGWISPSPLVLELALGMAVLLETTRILVIQS